MEKLKGLLEYCESVIDTDKIHSSKALQKQALSYENIEASCIKISYPCTQYSTYSILDVHKDMAKMMYNELVSCMPEIEGLSDGTPMLRANYGVGTFPSFFGIDYKFVGENMPWVEPVAVDKIKRIIDKGVPEIKCGLGQKLIETYEFYVQMLEKYPKCKKSIMLFHPDFQGPFDVAELIWGADIYLAMYDEPELVHSLLDVITESYISLMKKLKLYLNDDDGDFHGHWNALASGHVLIRDDSAVNLSADMYKEFVQPYDEKILKAFDKGTIHFCGRADQWVLEMAKSESLSALNFGFVENQDFSIKYLDFLMPTLQKLKKSIVMYIVKHDEIDTFDFTKYITGITYHATLADKEQAIKLLKRFDKI